MELSATVQDDDGTERIVSMIGLPAARLNAGNDNVDSILSERKIYREMLQSNGVVGFV